MASQYPSINDRSFDLLKKIANNTAELTDGGGTFLTQAEGDARYLQLTGGTLTGALKIDVASTVEGLWNVGNTRLDGNTGIGAASNPNLVLTIGSVPLASGASIYGAYGATTAPTGTTLLAQFYSNPRTAAALALTTMSHFRVGASSLGAGSSITQQEGFIVPNNMTQGAVNYGFRGQLAADGVKNYNLYMDGTAPNYLNGYMLMSSSIADADATFHLYVYSGSDSPPLWQRGIVGRIGGTFTGNDANAYHGMSGWAAMTSGGFNNTNTVRGISMLGQGGGVGGNFIEIIGGSFTANINNSATATALHGVYSTVANSGTANSTTGTIYSGYWSKGSTGLIATIYGVNIEAPPAGWGATLAAAYSSAWTAASNRYGIYMSGTVQNYMGGALTVNSSINANPTGLTLAAGTTTYHKLSYNGTADAGGTSTLRGFSTDSEITGANAFAQLIGIRVNASASHTTGTSTLVNGITATASLSGAGALTTANVMVATLQITAAGNLTAGAAYRSASPSLTSTGLITTAYGHYIEKQKVTGVTTGYGIYQEDAGDINYFAGQIIKGTGTNGQALNIKSLTELTTIAAAATTDTTIQLPAGAIILSVAVRTTVIIPTATSYSVGDSGSAARFNTANVGVAANSTDVGTKAGAYYNASALAVRLTMNGGTPAANTGRVRVTITYIDVTVPTS